MAYYRTEITAGMTVEVYNSFTKRVGVKNKRSKRKPTPEEMKKINQTNAENKLRRKINANFGQGDFHLVLTYKKDERPTPEEAKENIRDFLIQMRKAYKGMNAELKYINVTEYKAKAIHHHLIINDVENQNISKLVRSLWSRGNPHFTPLDETGQYKTLASYLIKETKESYKESDGGQKQRYSCSRNLVNPKEKVRVIKKAKKWATNPRPKKGYYIDQDTVYNGVDAYNGREYQRYTMIKLLPFGTNNKKIKQCRV